MRKITGEIRSYAWGSRTALANLRGLSSATPYPEAELWYGAHSSNPSRVVETPYTLLEYIQRNPRVHLGEMKNEKNALPFMVKLLAAEEPLSLQAHPSAEQALQGFHKENLAGIALDNPLRNYRDGNSKPEMLIALEKFELLAGFAIPEKIVALFDELIEHADSGSQLWLHQLRELISGQPDSDGIRACFTTIVTLPTSVTTDLIAGIIQSAIEIVAQGISVYTQHCRVLLTLGEMYPHDFGVIAAIMLNHMELSPGQAIFIPASAIHTYIHGVGVEILANSDNVLRAGLTAKHVDVPELLKIVDFTPLSLEKISINPQVQTENMQIFQVGIDEFQVYVYSLTAQNDPISLPEGKPMIAVCTSGNITLKSDIVNPLDISGNSQNEVEHTVDLRAGEGSWISVRDKNVTVQANDVKSYGNKPENSSQKHHKLSGQLFVVSTGGD